MKTLVPSEFSKLSRPFSKYNPSHSNKITRTHCITHSTYTRFKINYNLPRLLFFSYKKKLPTKFPSMQKQKIFLCCSLVLCSPIPILFFKKRFHFVCNFLQRCSQHQKSPTLLSHFRYILANILFPLLFLFPPLKKC